MLATSVVLAAQKIELESDKSVLAEIIEDKAGQHIIISLAFIPVTTLDPVTNDEMTEILAQFYAEETLSSYLKAPKTIDFHRTKCIVHKKTAKQCTLTYKIPTMAILDVKEEQLSISAEAFKKSFGSFSSDALLQDFRSTCFRDLRIAEAVFLEQIKLGKNQDSLAGKIREALSALEKKIHDDDALFLSEKEELLAKVRKVRDFLLNKLSAGESLVKISNANIIPVFQEFLFAEKILLEIGGCKAFQTEDGRIFLISVGRCRARGDSAEAKIHQERIAEQKAYAEIAKYKGIEVVVFASLEKEISRNVKREEKYSKRKTKKITIRSAEFMYGLPTVGTWFSADGTVFYLAKGKELMRGDFNE